MKVITNHFEKPTVSLKSKTISVGNSKTLTSCSSDSSIRLLICSILYW